MRPRRGCAAGSHAGCARAGCWCESAANAPPGKRSRRVSPQLPLPPARRPWPDAGHAASRSLGQPSRAPRDVLAGMDRLEHGRDLPHLGRGHVTEDVAVPLRDAPLPGRIRKELSGALGQPNAGIRGDQPDTLQPAVLEMLEERAPATLVLLRPLANAENFPITALVYADRNQQRDVAHLAGPAALEHDAIEINIRVLALDRTIAPGLDRPVDLLVDVRP